MDCSVNTKSLSTHLHYNGSKSFYKTPLPQCPKASTQGFVSVAYFSSLIKLQFCQVVLKHTAAEFFTICLEVRKHKFTMSSYYDIIDSQLRKTTQINSANCCWHVAIVFGCICFFMFVNALSLSRLNRISTEFQHRVEGLYGSVPIENEHHPLGCNLEKNPLFQGKHWSHPLCPFFIVHTYTFTGPGSCECLKSLYTHIRPLQ